MTFTKCLMSARRVGAAMTAYFIAKRCGEGHSSRNSRVFRDYLAGERVKLLSRRYELSERQVLRIIKSPAKDQRPAFLGRSPLRLGDSNPSAAATIGQKGSRPFAQPISFKAIGTCDPPYT